MTERKKRVSNISLLHYYKLVFRSLLLIGAAVAYIVGRVRQAKDPFADLWEQPILLGVIWVVFVVEMLLRFFPSKIESMGCQKQFARNFIPTEETEPKKQSWRVTALIAVLWLLLNAGIGALYYTRLIDRGILLLISLVFSVCDMICILFFCPFQTWFMKNKCCGSCRIYNWDYAMMFTPLAFIRSFYTWSLLGLALALLFVWELLVHRHPERFSQNTNACLSCANCKEKLCHHKKQLRRFLKKNKDLLILRGNALLDKTIKRNDSKKK